MDSGRARGYPAEMDWKILIATFSTVFVAELGDKTMLSTLTFSASSKSKWSVFIGSAVALVLAAGIAVLAGELVTRVIHPLWLTRIASVAFIVIGAVMLIGTLRS